jgi:DNA-binding FadR family transcriptional regulator
MASGFASVKNLPASKVRIPGVIARDLGIRIVSGMLRPGSLLEKEADASEQRKVSRSAYREAVRILVAKGLVESKPKVGTRVNERSKWHLLDPDLLAWFFQTEPDYALVYNLFELRTMVEPMAAAMAAERRTQRHLNDMSEALKTMGKRKTVEKEWREADERFHTALLEACGNPFLTSLTSSINAAISWSTVFKQRHAPLKRDPVPDHRKVYQAIANSNSQAAYTAMEQLVNLALADITAAPTWPRIVGGVAPLLHAHGRIRAVKR